MVTVHSPFATCGKWAVISNQALQGTKTNTKNPLIIRVNDSIIALYADHSARYLFKVRR